MDERIHQKKEIVDCLQASGVVCMKSDTIYGLFARFDDDGAVRKVRKLKGRFVAGSGKNTIILCASIQQAAMLGVDPLSLPGEILQSERPTTVVVSSAHNYTHLRAESDHKVSLRIVQDGVLAEIIRVTGPLTAPSANPKGEAPAANIQEARDYFGDAVDLYVDSGFVQGSPSRVIRVTSSGVEILRP